MKKKKKYRRFSHNAVLFSKRMVIARMRFSHKSMVAISGNMKYQHLSFKVLHNVPHKTIHFFLHFCEYLLLIISLRVVYVLNVIIRRRIDSIRFSFVVYSQTFGTSILLENVEERNNIYADFM